ncbi:OPT oligopeptide transporter protein-domain-containing protein [Kockovaella imperatae]|uniref:OPT oligopeptide transporter protein-domain-containing protein n=1 Tax=Kockovaella imperatae TaxID=4999 RepID=A0A1Y1UFY6_9TREE|nr:OPT oligopeptide transporter protein-domain-containing protein [Kockovaella imperatae]ORX36938.1 OPT oligopeptide transporter protein-domain-containing protein [Kockovaella imperatae]
MNDLHDDARSEKDLDIGFDPTHLLEKGDKLANVTSEEVAAPLYRDAPPEVKACVPEVDDVDTPCETFRAYILGTICAVVGTGLNTWFGSRQPGVYVSPLLAQFIVHPVGVFMAKLLPTRRFNLMGHEMTLNPGPWNTKEHTIVTLMATVSFPTATAIDIIIATKLPVFFNDPELGGNLGYQFLIVLSTQFLGFGLAGMAREYLVFPPAMIWPLNLAKVSLFNALHRRRFDEHGEVVVDQEADRDPPVHGWRISGFRFCLYVTMGSFAWFFVTAFLCPFLTYFNWPTWIAPTNKKLAIIMGSFTGLGINPVPTFDWTFISGAGLTPLITPWWATLQIFIGASLGVLIIIALYFSNTWYTSYLLPNSNAAFDRFGHSYNVSRVLNPDHTINEVSYRAYSPLYYSAGYNLVFGAYFAQYSAAIVYAVLDHGEQLKIGFTVGYRQMRALFSKRHGKSEVEEAREMMDYDIHYRLMKAYPDAPQWWFGLICLAALIMGIVACEVYKNTMPIWGIFVCLAMAAVFLVPSGIIMAISNVQIILVVLAEIIPGAAIPGRPYANMVFKIYGWVALIQALLYVQDQKLAHYMHVPPRATFRAQMWGVLIGTFVTLGVINWQMSVVPDLCVPGQKDLLTCPYYTTFFSSALLFGVLGPKRVYGSKGLYKNLLWAFFVGAALTIIASLAKRKWPKNNAAINIPVIISGAQYFAPYNWAFVYAGVPLAWTFMRYLYRHYHSWWSKYCYILSIGLTVGAALSGIIQFFCITYPGASLNWWGTEFYVSGCDGLGCPLKELPEVGYFGPGVGPAAIIGGTIR